MITDKTNGESLKEIRKRKKEEETKILRAKCEALAFERYGEDPIKKLSNTHGGIWYLPVWAADDPEETIEFLAIMKPINRNILSYASTKMEDGGLYDFLQAGMEECFVEGDKEIFTNEEAFIAAANSFNKILEGKKSAMLKR